MLVKPRAGQPARIKVVGVGGGGNNAISSMIRQDDIQGVEFIAVNTDAQALLNNPADTKIQIGDALTKGLGSGGNPEVGSEAAQESRAILKEHLEGADMIFIAAGEGGGTGTGAAPIVAEVGREVGALTIAVVTKPFVFEGARRKTLAEEGVDNLKDKVDTLIVIPNQKVLEIIDAKSSMLEAFKKVDSILHHGVKGISELITLPGLINVDFADVRSIMENAGTALMGIGSGNGDNRTTMAIKEAISSPLLETSMEGAKGVLFNIVGGPDMTMIEVDEAATIVTKAADPDADIIFGAVIDEKMVDQVKITVIATRFDERRLRMGVTSARMSDEFIPPVRATQQEYRNHLKQEMGEQTESGPQDTQSKSLHHAPKHNPMLDDDETSENEFDIPAFLRRKS